jgi:enoyl-CoA hydratase
MTYKNVILEKEGYLAVLTVNRPKALNALNKDTLVDIKAALEEIDQDAAIKVAIITGAGEKSFVAGADIAYMQNFTVQEAREFAAFG